MEFLSKNINLFVTELFVLCMDMAPYLLLGMLVAGLISVFIDKSFIYKHIGSKSFSSIFKAAMFGVPLPLCSCGVIPVASTIKDAGASKGSTVSFLISTPQTGVDSIFLTYGMLGPVFAIFRPIAALLSGMLGGLVINNFDKQTHHHFSSENVKVNKDASFRKRLISGFRYGFITLPSDILEPLFQGLLIAASISVFIPTGFVIEHFADAPAVQFVTMLLISIPIYVCATASIPIALAMMAKGITPGAAFVFLMAGPTTNASSIAVLKNILGKKTLALYLLLIAFMSTLFGLAFDLFFKIDVNTANHHLHQHSSDGFLKYVSLIAFVFVMINAFLVKFRTMKKSTYNLDKTIDDGREHLRLSINGMTCSHCKESVESIAGNIEGIDQVVVDLPSGQATFIGNDMNSSVIKDKIISLGFTLD